MSCCVKGCKNIKRLMDPSSDVTFHRIPKKRQQEFINVLGLPEKPNTIRVICSIHFLTSDFIISVNNRKFLKKDVLPSLNIRIVTPKPSTYTIFAKEILPSSTLTAEEIYQSGYIVPISFIKSTSQCVKQKDETNSSSTFHHYSSTASPEVSHMVFPKERSTMNSSEQLHIEPEFSSSSTSSDTEMGVKFNRVIHSYSTSPAKMKKCLDQSKEKLKACMRQLHYAKKTILSLKKQNTSLKEIIDNLKSQRMPSDT